MIGALNLSLIPLSARGRIPLSRAMNLYNLATNVRKLHNILVDPVHRAVPWWKSAEIYAWAVFVPSAAVFHPQAL